MKVISNTHFYLVPLYALTFTTILILLLQTNTSDVFFLYFPSSFSLLSPSSWAWAVGGHSNAITLSSPSSSLSRAEEKRRRAKKRLSDAVDEVLSWRRRDDQSDAKLQSLEKGLTRARALIREAPLIQNDTVSSKSHYVPKGAIYKNDLAFHRSYLLMEKMFKIFVYEEGEPPIFHHGQCKNIYSIEGLFINLMEKNARFRTRDPDHAHAFFLPFSVVMIINHLFDPIVRDKAVLERTMVDYIGTISTKYPFWNRSIGVDHFMLSCHDWGPRATWYHPLLYFHSIRALCNANTSEHFNPKKDASIPEINLPTGDITGFLGEEALSPSNRSILAFFAGRMHGHIRPALLDLWKEKDRDLVVYELLPKGVSYEAMMRRSKYCICPSGFEVASPRIVEAIYVGCVPVLISQDYVLPFSDVLDWDSFSVKVSVEEIQDLKRILMGISEERYLRLHENVKQVQRHFVVNDPPKRYDVFHMIVHSIWLRRLNVRING